MPPDFFKTIASVLARRKLDVVLVGGWAVNHHGFHRQTNDVDFSFVFAKKTEMEDALESIGFSRFSDSPLVTRFRFKEPFMPGVDVLWVEEDTQRKLLESSEPLRDLPGLRVIGLPQLLAMKLHALKQRDERGPKDLLDILTLMKHNPNAPSRDEFKALCGKFGPTGIYDELTARWKL